MKHQKLFALALAFVMAAGFAGCGEEAVTPSSSGSPAPDGSEPAVSSAPEPPAKITIFAQGWEGYDGADKDRVWEAVEQATNTELSLTGVPMTGYTDKINVMINTGEIPDIFEHWPEGNSEIFTRWVNEGLLLNLDEHVPEDGSAYPNIANIIYNDQYKNLKFAGQHIMVPWISNPASWGVYIRQDWLEKLNLDTPVTTDDFYNVMKAFATQDPDGNGQNDTYGLVGCKDAYWFMPLYAAWVEKPDWNYSADGSTIEYMYATEGYKEYLGYMRQAYTDGLIVKDFYTKSDDLRQEDFKTGKAGLMFLNVSFATGIIDQMQQINPNAKIDLIAPPAGPAGTNMHGWGGYSVSAETADSDACLRVLDYFMSEEGSELIHYGVEGVHYTKNADGTRSITDENIAARLEEPEDRFLSVMRGEEEQPLGFYNWGQWFGPCRSFADGKILIQEDYSNDTQKELLEKGSSIASQYCKVSDMSNIVVEDTEYSEIAAKVSDITTTYTINIIVGEIDLEAGWTEMLQKLDEIGYSRAQKMAYDALQAAS